MEIIRKTIKAYLITIVVFLVLTLILATLIAYTGFDEDWSFGGVIVILSGVTLLLGSLIGKIIGRRGLVLGCISSLVFLIMIIFTVKTAFSDSIISLDPHIILIVPLITGTIGGVVGANSNN